MHLRKRIQNYGSEEETTALHSFLLQFGRMFRGKLNLSLIFALSVANRPFSAEMRQNQILEVELESAKNREHAFNCIIELRRTVSFFLQI